MRDSCGIASVDANRARPRSEVLSEEARGSPAESEHMERKSTGKFTKSKKQSDVLASEERVFF
ncbi:hypothetical protein P343_07085 [Sporolactobacillus laevolacticus DSM 442]|uniref:Uncharacterized protein n=1 Tax=Sporolactobacillus laevolacticus DSM 442 TaxID=1395513 RepID=V6J6T7_9BACL|nr:hypothetical protein P343_07085 [Sporolactobacillus laevolacticus DSM 442]